MDLSKSENHDQRVFQMDHNVWREPVMKWDGSKILSRPRVHMKIWNSRRNIHTMVEEKGIKNRPFLMSINLPTSRRTTVCIMCNFFVLAISHLLLLFLSFGLFSIATYIIMVPLVNITSYYTFWFYNKLRAFIALCSPIQTDLSKDLQTLWSPIIFESLVSNIY